MNMSVTIINTLVRTLIAYVLLMAVTRFMGRKVVSQMTFFDFAVGITLGSVTASLSIGPQNSAASSATVLIGLGLLSVLTGYLHIKSFWARKIVNSEPVVLVDKGTIVDRNLRKVRFTINELNTLLREKNVFSMADVEFAILENDGKLSVLPKPEKQPLTPSDLSMPTAYKGLTKDIIIDGNIMKENLEKGGRNENWLFGQLEAQGVRDMKDVFYAGLDSSGSLYVSLRKKEDEKHGQYGIE